MVGTEVIVPVCDLGIYVDSNVSIRIHVDKAFSSSVFVLRRNRSISRSVSKPVKQSLVVSLVLTRFDYGSATLAALYLQCYHITPLLRDLQYQLALLASLSMRTVSLQRTESVRSEADEDFRWRLMS